MKSPLPIWRTTWALIRFRPWIFGVNLFFVAIYLLARVVPGWLTKLFYDQLTGEAKSGLTMWGILGLIVLVELGRMVATTTGEWGAIRMRNAGAMLLRKNVVQNILRKPGADPLPVAAGDVVTRLDDDAADHGDFPTWAPELFGRFLFTVVALFIMFRIAPLITLVTLLPMVGLLYLNRYAFGHFLLYMRESRESDSVVATYLGEIFGAVQAIKVAGAEGGVIAYFDRLNQARQKSNVRFQIFYALFSAVSDHMGDIVVGLMVVLAGVAIAQGDFGVGDFILFSTYLFFVARFPATVGGFMAEIAQQRVVIDRLVDIQPKAAPEDLIALGPIYERRDPPPLVAPVKQPADRLQTLQVKGLSYRFPPPHHTSPLPRVVTPEAGLAGIEEISFTLTAGTLTVITGPIGSGKTTLLRVLLGLLAGEGKVWWNGEPVTDAARFFVPPRSAYVPQVPRLFSESLRDNILMGRHESEVNLTAALQAAVLMPDVAKLEKGLDTIVGPRGVRLSGGQVQRAAAARALVRDASLLVFDDLSSALDVETEAQLWDQMLGTERTLLIVSHRPAVLHRADQILRLDKGRIATAD